MKTAGEERLFNNGPLIDAILNQDDARTMSLVEEAVANGVRPEEIISSGLQPAMVIVGEKFTSGEFFVPDMLLAGRSVSRALAVLEPRLSQSDLTTLGRVVIGTVFGDVHDIGKNLVTIMLKGTGFEVVDLGINVPAAKFVEAVKQYKPDILALSALVTTTMVAMGDVIKALSAAGLRSQVKVIVGGAPVTRQFAEKIGADEFGADSGVAMKVCRNLIGK
ncbi:MAG: corrinoid protein [Chloroflexi bacterium]|nr:corrinoid protein [Chloroflexota bacterium]